MSSVPNFLCIHFLGVYFTLVVILKFFFLFILTGILHSSFLWKVEPVHFYSQGTKFYFHQVGTPSFPLCSAGKKKVSLRQRFFPFSAELLIFLNKLPFGSFPDLNHFRFTRAWHKRSCLSLEERYKLIMVTIWKNRVLQPKTFSTQRQDCDHWISFYRINQEVFIETT